MKTFNKMILPGAFLLFAVVAATRPLSSRESPNEASGKPKDRAQVLFSHALPKLESDHLKVTIVEVNYGPGEASPPHSHPCVVVGYVLSGSLRTQIQGEPEMIYKTGETFYEAPNGIHLVSANASATEPAKLLAYLICDQDSPLSVDPPKTTPQKGSSK